MANLLPQRLLAKYSKIRRLTCLTLVFICFSSIIYGQSKSISKQGDGVSRKDEHIYGKSGSISGKINTSDGEPAEGVSIALIGSSKKSITNKDGRFIFRNLKPGRYELIVSFVGLHSLYKEVEVQAGKSVNVLMAFKENSAQINEVVVKGNKNNRFIATKSDDVAKMPLAAMENPQAYSTVTKSLLTEQSAFNLDNALRNVPGIVQLWAATDRAGFGSGSSFSLRGFQLTSNLKNGIPTNVSTTIDNANIESVEVLKGPSATLFGSAVTGYGGLINQVTKKPYDHAGGEISYSGGSFGLNRLSADVNTPLDSAKSLLFRINLALNTQNSWQDAGFHRNIFVSPALSFQASKRLSFSFESEVYISSGTTAQTFFFPPAAIMSNGSSTLSTTDKIGVSRADQLNLDYKRSYVSNDLILKSKNLNFTGKMSYILSENWTSQTNISLAYTSSHGPMTYFYLLPGNKQIARCSWRIDGSDQTLDIQQNFLGHFTVGSLKNRIVAGIDYYYYSTNVQYTDYIGSVIRKTASGLADTLSFSDLFDVVNTTGSIPNYHDFNKKNVDSANAHNPLDPASATSAYKKYIPSVYFSDVINLGPNLVANIALRLDHFYNAGNYNPVSKTTSGSFRQTTLSPKFGLIYKIAKEQVSLFANYQNGFSNQTGTAFNGKAFKPEQANQIEGGIKLKACNGQLSGTISYYDIRVKNTLRPDLEHPQFSVQDGSQSSKGLEVDLLAHPAQGLTIVAGYAHNESKYTKASDDINGFRPPTSGPKDMANFWLSYHITQGAVKGLGAGFGGNFVGKSLVLSSKSNGLFYLPAYTLLNGTAFYEAKRWRLTATVNNLSNKKYWIGWTTVNPQQTRSIIGSIAFKF